MGREFEQHVRGPGTILNNLIATNPAVAEHHDALGKLSYVLLVRDQDKGQTLPIEILEDLHDLDRGPAIQVAGRLIGQQNRRTVYQSTRNGYSLLLASRELRGKMFHAVGEANHLQSLARAFPRARLFVDQGQEQGWDQASLAQALAELTGAPRESILSVELRARHAYVSVAPDAAEKFLAAAGKQLGKGPLLIEIARRR